MLRHFYSLRHPPIIRNILLLQAFFTSWLTYADEAPLWKNVEGWEVRVDLTLQNGCFASAVFDGNTVFRIGIDGRDGQTYFMITDDDWHSLEVGKKYVLDIKFGNETPWKLTARAIDLSGATFLTGFINDEMSSVFLQEFKNEAAVSFFYQENQIARLSLRGSYAAGLEIQNCQKVMNDSKSKTDPFKNSSRDSDPFI